MNGRRCMYGHGIAGRQPGGSSRSCTRSTMRPSFCSRRSNFPRAAGKLADSTRHGLGRCTTRGHGSLRPRCTRPSPITSRTVAAAASVYAFSRRKCATQRDFEPGGFVRLGVVSAHIENARVGCSGKEHTSDRQKWPEILEAWAHRTSGSYGGTQAYAPGARARATRRACESRARVDGEDRAPIPSFSGFEECLRALRAEASPAAGGINPGMLVLPRTTAMHRAYTAFRPTIARPGL